MFVRWQSRNISNRWRRGISWAAVLVESKRVNGKPRQEHVAYLGDNIRLRAAEMILDRGVGRPGQAVSLDVSLTKPLESMSVEELQQFRERYAAIVTASPALIEHVLADDEANEEQIAMDLVEGDAVSEVDGAPSAEELAPPPRRRGRPRRQPNDEA
jgi:hypothetical protein